MTFPPTGCIRQADEAGTEAEARALLERAIAALKQDEAAALAAFTAGTPGFKVKDLYVFCVDPAGVVTANGGHPDHRELPVPQARQHRAGPEECPDQPGQGPDLWRRLLRRVSQ